MDEKNPNLENKEAVAEAVGSGAVIFSAVQNAKIKDVVFSYDKMLNFDGETCPYLQYTHARCNSVLAKAPKLNVAVDYSALDNAESWTLVKLLNSFEEIIETSATKYEPCILSKYLIDTAQAFNKFYFEHRILTDKLGSTQAMLQVVKSTKQVLQKGLALLGIATPEKM